MIQPIAIHVTILYKIVSFIISIFFPFLGFDPAQSTITGVASGDVLDINQTYTLTVQARDGSGNALTSSGETLYARLSDPCTRGADMSCTPSAFTQSAANGVERVIPMTDNGDGTYTADVEFNHFGDATISVYHVGKVDVVGEYYSDQNIDGSPDVTNTST